MSLDNAQEIGWIYSTAENDPISSSDEPTDGNGTARYWRFGTWTFDLQQLHPTETHDWQPIYKNLRNPADSELISTSMSRGLAYYPTNAIGLFLLMGACTTTAGVHAITNINTGSLPEICIRSESTGPGTDKYFSARGVKISSVSGQLNTMGSWPYLTETLTYDGIRNDTASLQGAHTPDYPTSNGNMAGYTAAPGTEENEQYRFDNNFEFRWDSSGGAGGDDYDTQLALMNYTHINKKQLASINNQVEIESIREGQYQFLFSFSLWRGASANVWTDFLAETQHEMYFKIYKNATDYTKHTWTNATLINCEAPIAKKGEAKLWNVQGFAEDLAISAKDGVDVSFYKE